MAIDSHTTLEVESLDRIYLKVIQMRLQNMGGIAWFFRKHRGEAFATAKVMAEMTRPFVAAIETFAKTNAIPLIGFERGQRKDDLAKEYLADFPDREGILFIGTAQEKAYVVRTITKKHPETGRDYPWLMKSSAMVNHYYFYCVDEDFGPFFIKFCSYFPYDARLCINGHEYAKRQLDKRGIKYEPLDNGILSCEDPQALQKICEGLNEAKIEKLLRKWLKRLPHPFPAKMQLIFDKRMLGDEEFQSLTSPQEVDGQRVSGLKFADPVVLAVLTALLMFRFLPRGFRNGELRRDVSQLLARPAHDLSPGQMTYQLRRLRLRGLITRIPGTQRYEVTDSGQRMALFWLGSMSKTIRPLATSLTDETVQQKILNEIKKTIERNAMAAANSKT